ncbi:MAG: MMPL family transporter [Myxococcales bacterium]|nr:MMPL family transporter [Myxococcales bacterium]
MFGVQPLERIARVTEKLKKIPYVRNVRSLTENPWIRWGKVAPEEDGLIVSDLFENKPSSYSEDERLYRMVVTLGAQRAAKLIGEAKVRSLLGPTADLSNFIGEPRLLRSVVSEDGRTTAIQIQILRPKITDQQLDKAFGAEPSHGKSAATAIHTSATQSHVLDQVDEVLRAEVGVRWHLAGIPVLERYFPIVSKRDMPFIGLLIVAVIVILYVLYRRILCVVIPLLVMMTSILAMNGTAWLMGDLMTNLTAVAPNVLIAVGIGNSVHLLTTYFVLRPRFHDKRSLLQEVLRTNWVPALLTSTTTAIGFFSLMSSALRPMASFGYTLGIGTLYAYLLTMTVVPAMLSLLPLRGGAPRPAGTPEIEGVEVVDPRHWSARLVRFTTHNRNAIVAGTGLLLALSALGLYRMNLATDMRTMFPKTDPVRSDLEWIADKLGGAGDLELLFQGPPPSGSIEDEEQRSTKISRLLIKGAATSAGAVDPVAGLSAEDQAELRKLQQEEEAYHRSRIATSEEFLRQVDGLQRRIEEEATKPGSNLSKLTSFDSGLSVLRKMHQVQNENRVDFYRVPTSADVPESARKPVILRDEVLGESGDVVIPAQTASSLASQYYLQFENGAQPSETLSTMITRDQRGFRISARLDQAPTSVLLAAFEEIREIARKEFPALQGTPEQVAKGEAIASMTMTGRLYLYMHMFEYFVSTLISSLSTSLITITILFALVFRSLKLGVVSMIPNILPVVIPLGAIGLLGLPLDGPVVLVASIVLGVCVDDTTHILWKYSESRKAGRSVDESLKLTFRVTGSAVSASTLILVLGFAMLIFSNLRPNIVIGYMSAIMLSLGWFCEFLLMPAVIRFFEKEKV